MKSLGFIKIKDVRINKDNTVSYDLEYDKTFEKNLKEALKIKRLTKVRVLKIIRKALITYCVRHKGEE